MIRDAYIEYTHRFFGRWVPVYDLFARSIAPIYGYAARRMRCGPERPVIDICAGTGEMTVRCARAGSPVTAVDITPAMLECARRKSKGLPVECLLMDARRLEFPDKSFDYGTISLALHDMPHKVRVQVLREAVRVTRRRIVILDYDFPRSPLLRRPLIAAVNLFESAYFKRFAEVGLGRTLDDAGLADAPIRRRRLPLFAVHTIDLATAPAGADAEDA